MQITRVGVDLAKNIFQVHGVDSRGRQIFKRQLKRSNWLKVLSQKLEPGCEIGMEACGGAHHWARELHSRGFEVKLIAPQFVKPFVKSLKNDANDAEAVCEAMSRPRMRFVTIKTAEQQDIQALHRVRDGLMRHRKAKANQIRGLVTEYGLVAPKTIVALRRAVPEWLEDGENGLSATFRELLYELWEDFRWLEQRVDAMDRRLTVLSDT
ncbi:MAG: IS110 family transposase, partial [Gammaproteobacteria bacterium]|nr:IS110 family transposase [Gammaproteobacteria bacterium]